MTHSQYIQNESPRVRSFHNSLGDGRKLIDSRGSPKRSMWHTVDPNDTTITSVGVGAPTTDNFHSSSDKDEGPFHQYRTLGTTNSVAGVQSPEDRVAFSWGFRLSCIVRTGPNIDDTRMWVGSWGGLTSPYPTPELVSDPASISLAAFRYDTGAGDTTWQAFSADEGSPSASVDTGVTVETGAIYYMDIESDSTALRYYINGVRVAEISSVTPLNRMRFGYRCTTLANSVKRSFWSLFKLEY